MERLINMLIWLRDGLREKHAIDKYGCSQPIIINGKNWKKSEASSGKDRLVFIRRLEENKDD